MTVKTTLSFTDRHYAFLQGQVDAGVYATMSAAVAAAIEGLVEDDQQFQAHVAGLADVVRERMKTLDDAVDADEVYAELMGELDAARAIGRRR
jgi:antitoxin ParD1/3/4